MPNLPVADWYDVQRGPGDNSTKALRVDERLGVGCVVQAIEIVRGVSATALCFVPHEKVESSEGWQIVGEAHTVVFYKRTDVMFLTGGGALYKVIECMSAGAPTIGLTYVPAK